MASRDLNKQAKRLNTRSLAKKLGTGSGSGGLVRAIRSKASVAAVKKKARSQGPIGTGAGGRANAASLAKRKAAAKKKATKARAASQTKLRKRLHGTAKTKKTGTSARSYAKAKRPSYGLKRKR